MTSSVSNTLSETRTSYYTVSAKMNPVKNSSGYMMVVEDSLAWVSMDYQYGTYQWLANRDLAHKFSDKENALAAAKSKLGPWYNSPKLETIRVTKVTETRTVVSEEVDFD